MKSVILIIKGRWFLKELTMTPALVMFFFNRSMDFFIPVTGEHMTFLPSYIAGSYWDSIVSC